MKSAFDLAAPKYDLNFSEGKIGMTVRAITMDLFERYSGGGRLSLLELNAGTGIDAVAFAEKGHNVVATDGSLGMLRELNLKTAGYSNVKTRQLNLADQHWELAGEEKLDLIWSNFGGVNCLNDKEINHLVNNCSAHLSQSGLLMMVIMPSFCLVESLYFCAKFKFSDALRRIRKDVPAKIDGFGEVLTNYYNPKHILNSFAKDFELVAIHPVGIAIPPSYLNRQMERFPFVFNLLNKIESMLRNVSFLAAYSDHYFIALRRK